MENVWPTILGPGDRYSLYHAGEIIREWRTAELQDMLSVERGESVRAFFDQNAFVINVSACGRSVEIDVLPEIVASVKEIRQKQGIEPSTVSIPASELHGKERA